MGLWLVGLLAPAMIGVSVARILDSLLVGLMGAGLGALLVVSVWTSIIPHRR
ncbi:hypothetical protein [Sphingomonas sp. DT-204]|uniref:hypothetical protein n=1 Tax=Sphingomonas sp. DT-204 TaxID=3396166 RepID=UPI003F1DFACF